MNLRASSRINLHKILAAACVSGITLTGCNGNKSESSSPAPSTPTKAVTPTPNYSLEQIKANLIPPSAIAERMREIRVVLEGLKDKKVPSCSLSGVKLPNDPDIITRQFTRQAQPRDEIRYAQIIARYNSPQDAESAFQKIHKKANSCPPKRHFPPKRIDQKTYSFAHDDTWKVEEGEISGWRHLRGYERQVVPPSQTRYNVFYVMYDYAVRGNVVLGTLYMERTEPGESGKPIAKRATNILAKQLQKFG